MAAVTETTERALSIAEAAEVTGLSAHTLRYYERRGCSNPSAATGAAIAATERPTSSSSRSS